MKKRVFFYLCLLLCILLNSLFFCVGDKSKQIDGNLYVLKAQDGILYQFDWDKQELKVVSGFQNLRVLHFCAADAKNLWLHIQKKDGQNVICLWNQSAVQWEKTIPFSPRKLCAFKDGVLLLHRCTIDAMKLFEKKQLHFETDTGEIMLLSRRKEQLEKITDCVTDFLVVQGDQIGFIRPDLYVQNDTIHSHRDKFSVYEDGKVRDILFEKDIQGVCGCGEKCLAWKKDGLFRFSFENGIGERIAEWQGEVSSNGVADTGAQFFISMRLPFDYGDAHAYVVRLTDGKLVRIKGMSHSWVGCNEMFCWMT